VNFNIARASIDDTVVDIREIARVNIAHDVNYTGVRSLYVNFFGLKRGLLSHNSRKNARFASYNGYCVTGGLGADFLF